MGAPFIASLLRAILGVVQPNQNSDPLLDNSEDRPAGAGAAGTPAMHTFMATPGATKKKITPVNEAALRAELAKDAAAVKPPLDTSKIYNEVPRLPGPITKQRGPLPDPSTPLPPTHETIAVGAAQPVSVASLVVGLQTYAILIIAMSSLGVFGRLAGAFGAPTLTLGTVVNLLTSALPIIGGIYLLVGKRTAVVKAILIVIGLLYAYALVSYGVLILKIGTILSIIFVVRAAFAGAMVYWTWRIFSRVEALETADD
jgi:hypothetical protein